MLHLNTFLLFDKPLPLPLSYMVHIVNMIQSLCATFQCTNFWHNFISKSALLFLNCDITVCRILLLWCYVYYPFLWHHYGPKTLAVNITPYSLIGRSLCATTLSYNFMCGSTLFALWYYFVHNPCIVKSLCALSLSSLTMITLLVPILRIVILCCYFTLLLCCDIAVFIIPVQRYYCVYCLSVNICGGNKTRKFLTFYIH